MHVLVLGAGLSGLAAAYELSRAGRRVTLVECEPAVGGMARSFRVGEYWLDFGPHRFYSRDAELERHVYEVLDDDVVVRERRSRIHLLGRYFDYPLRTGNVLRNLPPGLLARSIWDYLAIRVRDRMAPIPDDNFESWVTRRFGRTLYELFFGTYTEKAWCMSPRDISADWASQRISQKSLADAVRQTLFPPRDGDVRGLTAEFLYPRNGGIGALARAYEEKVRAAGGEVLTGATVRRIERDRRRVQRVHVEVGGKRNVIGCDEVISTLPLPTLTPAITPAIDAPALAAAQELEYVGIVFVYLEVLQPSVSADHWIYLPERHLTIHRISEFKNFSDDAAPGDRTAVCCEITCRPGDATWNLAPAAAAEVAAGDLGRAGLVEPGRTRPLAVRRLSHAYPVYDTTYQPRLQRVRSAVQELENFTSTGRQGLFRYNNMDHSIAMGRKAARALLAGHRAQTEVVAAQAEYFG
ncbi:MAG: FAD-dependent oxidoreductase [bacterium]|nr:FAD-dependent oxidoreductase [bacterium]